VCRETSKHGFEWEGDKVTCHSTLTSVTVDRFVVFYQIHEQTDGTIVEIVRVTDGRRDLNRLFSDDDEDEEAP
jgi:plasmid stabilization system protein ParE